jgi:FkbM family methyltransferase
MLKPTMTRYGAMIFPPNDQYVGRSLSLYGEFSTGETRVFEQLIQPGWTVLDVGANVGAFTLAFARFVGHTGEVLAFEPQRVIFQMLCANVAMNEYFNVKCFHTALGNAERVISMPSLNYKGELNFGGITVEMGGKEGVELKRLDSFSLAAANFIKLDVEGHEREALLGAEQTIARFRPLLYIENDRRDKSAALIELLISWEYALYWHMPHLYHRDNFNHVEENVFAGTCSMNMLCMPPKTALIANSQVLRPVQGPEDWPL